MKMLILLALFGLAVSTGAHAASPTVHPVLQPSPVAPELPASQWWPNVDPAKGPPGGDA